MNRLRKIKQVGRHMAEQEQELITQDELDHFVSLENEYNKGKEALQRQAENLELQFKAATQSHLGFLSRKYKLQEGDNIDGATRQIKRKSHGEPGPEPPPDDPQGDTNLVDMATKRAAKAKDGAVPAPV